MRYLALLLCTFFATSCSRTTTNTTRYHEDGRAKPVVAIASMLDTTSFEAPWSVSEELTDLIVSKISQNHRLFIQPHEDLPPAENPFGADLSWIKKEFESSEFVVFLELVQHELEPVVKSKKPVFPQEVATNLNMGIRLRVMDVRGAKPKIVLQEMVKDSYYIPKTLLPTDYNTAYWGTPEYQKSPMAIAHMNIVQEISHRISDYILLAKSQ